MIQSAALRAQINRIAPSKARSLFSGADHVAELLPRTAGPALQLKLVVRDTAFRSRVDCNNREKMRHLFRVDVFDGGAGTANTERTEQEGHFVALYKLPGLFDRLGRTVGIVVGDEVYLAAVDAAAIVDRIDVGDQTFSGIAQRDAGPLNGNVTPTFTSALVTLGVSARACARWLGSVILQPGSGYQSFVQF